jgi:hypothetical protein
MQNREQPGLRLSVRVAHALNRLLTWGMRIEDRKLLLTEGLADWEAMAEARRGHHVIGRALRGIPSAIWIRLNDREVTSLPAGVAMSLIGLGGVAVGVQSSAYPFGFRRFVILASLGVMLVGLNFVRSPRSINLRKYRLAAATASIGFFGLAITLPTNSQWPYEAPVVETAFVDAAMPISFLIIAAGCGLVLAASFTRGRPPLVSLGGFVLVAGVALLGVAQLAWAFAMVPIDLTSALASVVIGLAALSFVHVLPRLRHIEIVGRERRSGHAETLSEDVR